VAIKGSSALLQQDDAPLTPLICEWPTYVTFSRQNNQLSFIVCLFKYQKTCDVSVGKFERQYI